MTSDLEKSVPQTSGETPSGTRLAVPRGVVDEKTWKERYALRKRRYKIPLILLFLTSVSTFFVAALQWSPVDVLGICAQEMSLESVRRMMYANWGQGLIYMVCVIAILLAHELGHFIATIYYRIPASLPIFLPFPVNPLGTFGAVIAMQGGVADRKQTFDVGIAGPLAGLVVAVPIMILGVTQLDLSVRPTSVFFVDIPIGMKWLIEAFAVPGYDHSRGISLNQLNPCFAAGWVGMLVTGMNMFPIGQLDGGHVTYTLFGKAAHWIARGTLAVAIAFMVYHDSLMMVLMVFLLLLVGTDHPETSNDKVKLGPFRTALGLASLSIPFLCFPPYVFRIMLS